MEGGSDPPLDLESLVKSDDLRVSKSPWGEEDEIGRLNWITPESQADVLRRVDGSRPFDLSVEYFVGMPAWTEAGDPGYQIWMTHTPQGSVNDDATGAGVEAHRRYSYAGSAISMYAHTGTHICGLNHIGHGGVFWNGWTEKENLGSRCWDVGGVFPPIIAEAVLLDIAEEHGIDSLPDSYAIEPDDVLRAAERQGTELRSETIVLLRTGRMRRWPDRRAFLEAPPGLGMEAAMLLCEDVGVMCLGLDVGGEALPSRQGTFLPIHAYLFATAGAPLFENLFLEELARDSVYEFGLIVLPLKLRGSTGVPVRPLALPLRAER